MPKSPKVLSRFQREQARMYSSAIGSMESHSSMRESLEKYSKALKGLFNDVRYADKIPESAPGQLVVLLNFQLIDLRVWYG